MTIYVLLKLTNNGQCTHQDNIASRTVKKSILAETTEAHVNFKKSINHIDVYVCVDIEMLSVYVLIFLQKPPRQLYRQSEIILICLFPFSYDV